LELIRSEWMAYNVLQLQKATLILELYCFFHIHVLWAVLPEINVHSFIMVNKDFQKLSERFHMSVCDGKDW